MVSEDFAVSIALSLSKQLFGPTLGPIFGPSSYLKEESQIFFRKLKL